MGVRIVPLLAVGVAAGGVAGVLRYRRDLTAAQKRLDQVDRRAVATRFGQVEYAERGAAADAALLVSHGGLQGCDGGLATMRRFPASWRVIAPSRFGYLGSSLPADATAADQADAFVELLDHLGLSTVDVVGISAGTAAAVQLALRHPQRVGHLVIMCGSFPGSPLTQAPPGWVKPLYSQPAMWLQSALARPLLARMVGVPDGFPRDAEQAAWVDWMLQSLFPVRPRFAGTMVDLYRTMPGINDYPLEKLTVPTLIVHAVDDPVASYDAAAAAAERIPGARLLTLDSGGHLMLGQTERITSAVTAFRGEPSTGQQA
jgi:pimeloyl-ACP methyl ester carboxylesterase